MLTQLTHHNASALGIAMGLQFAPQLLLLPWTGYAADHFNQRKLLIATQGAQARKMAIPFGPFLALGGIVGLLAGHHLVHIWLN